MILDILKEVSAKSTWVAWLTSNTGQAAEETRQFIDTCFRNIHPNKQRKLLQRLKNADTFSIEASIYELVAHELLIRLGLSPIFNPNINGFTPDISVEIQSVKFIADVFVTHNPLKTMKSEFLMIDAGEKAEKIANYTKEKAAKYKKLNLPLVIFVFLGDHRVDMVNIEQALFGITIHEIGLTRQTIHEIDESNRINSVFFSAQTLRPKYPNISAVVACDWFDSLNRSRPGKRLHCTVFHHWNPVTPLPITTFAEFPQIIWTKEDSDNWRSETIGTANAIKFISDGDIEFGIYSANNPW